MTWRKTSQWRTAFQVVTDCCFADTKGKTPELYIIYIYIASLLVSSQSTSTRFIFLDLNIFPRAQRVIFQVTLRKDRMKPYDMGGLSEGRR